MTPVERGRHCEQCCKTVVDFSGMTDEEVIRFFKKRAGKGEGRGEMGGGDAIRGSGANAASGVCGRFVSHQLRRELVPAPVQRNGVKGWPWVVAGAMLVAQGPDGGRRHKGLGKTEVTQTSGIVLVEDSLQRPDTANGPFMGTVMSEPTKKVRIVWDTTVTMKGDIVVGTPQEIVSPDTAGLLPDRETLPADTVTAYVPDKSTGYTGKVDIRADTTITSLLDTVSGVKVVIDSVVSIFKDTLASVSAVFRPSEVVKVFPNPVFRGGAMRMEWRGSSGRYDVALVSAGGAVIQQRTMDVGGKGQVDEWALPGGMAAGVYFLRVARPGEKVQTTEVLVQ